MWKQIQKRLQSPDSFVSLILGVAVVLVVGTLIYNYFTNRAGQTAKEQEQQKQGQISLPTTHTVAQGETLWMIAERQIFLLILWAFPHLVNQELLTFLYSYR